MSVSSAWSQCIHCGVCVRCRRSHSEPNMCASRSRGVLGAACGSLPVGAPACGEDHRSGNALAENALHVRALGVPRSLPTVLLFATTAWIRVHLAHDTMPGQGSRPTESGKGTMSTSRIRDAGSGRPRSPRHRSEGDRQGRPRGEVPYADRDAATAPRQGCRRVCLDRVRDDPAGRARAAHHQRDEHLLGHRRSQRAERQ